jgi:hypothetical protein
VKHLKSQVLTNITPLVSSFDISAMASLGGKVEEPGLLEIEMKYETNTNNVCVYIGAKLRKHLSPIAAQLDTDPMLDMVKQG